VGSGSLLGAGPHHRHKLTAEQQARLADYLAVHPALESIYRFKQRLCYLLLKRHRTRKQWEQLVPRLLRAIYQLRQAGLAQLVSLGETLHSCSAEIATMWRFTATTGLPKASATFTTTDFESESYCGYIVLGSGAPPFEAQNP